MTQAVETATYTVKQAAKILGVGEKTLYRLVQEGGLPVPVIRVRETIRIPRRQLEAWASGELA